MEIVEDPSSAGLYSSVFLDPEGPREMETNHQPEASKQICDHYNFCMLTVKEMALTLEKAIRQPL